MSDPVRRRLIIVAMHLPLGCTSEQVSEILWTQIGLQVDPSDISCKDSGLYSASAYIQITEDSIVELLQRNFKGVKLGEQRHDVTFEKKRWHEDVKVTVEKFSITLPTNKNEIRRLD